MKYLKYAIFILSIFLPYSCTQSSSNTSEADMFVEAAANTGTTSGIIPLHGGFLVSPDTFNIDIRVVKIKSKSGSWFVLKDSPYGSRQEIVRTANIVNGTPIPADDYSAFLIGFGAQWNAMTSNTGTQITINYTNNDNTIYCLAATADMTNSYTNAAITILSGSHSVFGGNNYWLYLNFNSDNIIEIVTNSSGSVVASYLYNPSLSVDFK